MKATIHGLAGSGAELRDQLGVIGMAMRTFNCFFAKHFRGAELLFGIGWRNAKGFEFFLSFFGHPIRRPCRRKLLLNGNIAIALFDQLQANVHADDIHRRTARISRCDHDADLITFHLHISYNTQINDGKHWHFRIFHVFQDVPELFCCNCCMKFY